MARKAVENSLEQGLLELLVRGGTVEEFAQSLGVGMAELAEAIDVKKMVGKARGLASLQQHCEQIVRGRERMRALVSLGTMLEQKQPREGTRRVCKELLRGRRTDLGPATLAACQFLHEVLAQGPRSANEVLLRAKERGIPEITLRRAKALAGVVTQRKGFHKCAHFQWKLREPQAVEQEVNCG